MKPSIAIIGTGHISHFHVPALRAAGFNIVSCCGSPNSRRAKEFASKHDIKKVYLDVDSLLIDSSGLECILIASSVSSTFEILVKCLKTGLPILVEKPVSINPIELLSVSEDAKNICVGYNRRFYSTVEFAKKFIQNNNPCFVKLELPDNLDFSVQKNKQSFFSLRENSVHGFDILNYILPNLNLTKIFNYNQPGQAFGKNVFLESPRGDTVLICLNWNSPSNFSINIEASPYRLELKPFETYSLYEGMEVIEASEDYPVRQYVPKLIEKGNVFFNSKEFKPGFLEQSVEFRRFVEGKKSKRFANINDAFKAADLADKIILG